MDAVMDMEPAICAVTKAESIENTDVITMRNINKSYRMGTQSLHVLKDVSLTVKQGEYLAILGPSGSGKSTLMNIIGCMDVMDSGNYLLDGIIGIPSNRLISFTLIEPPLFRTSSIIFKASTIGILISISCSVKYKFLSIFVASTILIIPSGFSFKRKSLVTIYSFV